jgi:hypothetical protein
LLKLNLLKLLHVWASRSRLGVLAPATWLQQSSHSSCLVAMKQVGHELQVLCFAEGGIGTSKKIGRWAGWSLGRSVG